MRRSFVWLLVVAACDTTIQANPGDDCPAVCDRVVACNLPNAGVDVCVEVCQSDVAAAGTAGKVVTAGCLACLQSKDCAAIVAGQCASACPDSLFDGPNGCDPGEHRCNGDCIGTQADVNNCGGCGVACTTTGQICSLGVCTTGPCVAGGCAGKSWCDTATSACKPGCERDTQCDATTEQCDLPTHACACRSGFHSCGGACVPDDDANACGVMCTVCTHPANATAVCESSSCDYVCDPGLFRCDGGCCAATGITAGALHSCAVLSDHTLRCWGKNSYGQLGDGTGTDHVLPTPVTDGAAFSSVIAGAYNTCALTTGGGLKCWGYNEHGELGDGSTSARLSPVDVSGLTSGAAQVHPGYDASCAVTTGGAARCWGGDNMFGELGDGTMSPSASPVTVTGVPAGFTQISPGDDFTCAVTTAGGVKCWGYGEMDQLGDGLGTSHKAPGDVTGLTSGVARVGCGDSHCCALLSSGGVKCWGDNEFGELGDGSVSSRPSPVDVSGLSTGVLAFDVASSAGQGCALITGGIVKCWGTAMGLTPPVVPEAVAGFPTNTVAIAAGGSHVCGLTDDGRVLCAGTDDDGQLGDGTQMTSMSAVYVSGR